MNFPQLGQPLSSDQIHLLQTISKSCRRSIIQMIANAQSGHPGGSCSAIDFLTLVYAFVISQTGEDVVVSNGHVSPAVYSILIEMGYLPREEVVNGFRKVGQIYEGHITRHVKGITYGTGPLGIGVSVASGFALAEQLKQTGRHVFGMVGDGECDEGQVYEMMHFANKYKLNNYTLFVDYNQVQLSDSLEKIMPINPKAIFHSADWQVIEVNGHDFNEMWQAVHQSYQSNKPTLLLGRTVMGKGVSFMEQDGIQHKATWHGVAPGVEQTAAELAGPLAMSVEEMALINEFQSQVTWQPPEPSHPSQLQKMEEIKTGAPYILPAVTKTDCRSAYGKALLDLAKLNDNVLAITADLGGSVKTDVMGKEFPERHFDVGIAEQHMVSMAGGLSFKGFIPFVSTFGAFMSSRAKDQARVNDINQTNVKMVATHCGLSVGEDGPTHQAIDDMGSFLGMFNTHVLEPADANQTDHIIRFIASHYGNFYVRMGRHKFEVILKEDGTPYYDENYQFEYGKADIIRNGTDLTVIAGGSMVNMAVQAADQMKGEISVEVVAVSSLKQLDEEVLITSLQKTGKLITYEDHNAKSGLATQINSLIAKKKVTVEIRNLAVEEYQLSGTSDELYIAAGLGRQDLIEACRAII